MLRPLEYWLREISVASRARLRSSHSQRCRDGCLRETRAGAGRAHRLRTACKFARAGTSTGLGEDGAHQQRESVRRSAARVSFKDAAALEQGAAGLPRHGQGQDGKDPAWGIRGSVPTLWLRHVRQRDGPGNLAGTNFLAVRAQACRMRLCSGSVFVWLPMLVMSLPFLCCVSNRRSRP